MEIFRGEGPFDRMIMFVNHYRKRLEHMGFVQARPRGEYHSNSPQMTKLLHKAVKFNQYDHYAVYKEHLKGSPVAALRDLLDLKSDRNSIAVEEVESVEAIMRRFCTGGMSLNNVYGCTCYIILAFLYCK